jgi:hypothetical protein
MEKVLVYHKLGITGKHLPSSNQLLLWDSNKIIKEHLKFAVKTVGGSADVGREDFSATSRSGTAWAASLSPHIVTTVHFIVSTFTLI